MCRTMNVYEAEKQMDRLIHLHGNPSDANTIAIKNLLVVMMYTTTLLEEEAVNLMLCFLQTDNLLLGDAMQNPKKHAVQ